MAKQRAEMFEDILAKLKEHLVAFDIPDERAEAIGCSVVDMLAQDWGGQQFSMPRDCAFRLSQLERQILADLDAGATKEELVRTYQYTRRGLNRLIVRARHRKFLDTQMDLFGRPEQNAA